MHGSACMGRLFSSDTGMDYSIRRAILVMIMILGLIVRWFIPGSDWIFVRSTDW